MDSLLFPVKLTACFVLIGAVAGCGYHPVYGGAPPSVRLAVVSATNKVAEPVAIDAALDGARATLASEAALDSGSGYPRLVVEVLRIDEVGRGLFAEPGATQPVGSRGAGIAVTVRGIVQPAPGSAAARDSGDIRRSVTYAHRNDARFDALSRREAVRAAAYEAGRALARRVLGEPEPGIELL